ncbi:MAG: sigma-70 family RNA polymerase sigma factor, partial [Gemmatimonadales bacterium]
RRDEHAAGLLYDRHGGLVYALAYRIVGEQADAEEVLIETFAQAWRDAVRFDPDRGSVLSWLATIARSRSLDKVRAGRRRHRLKRDIELESRDSVPGMNPGRGDPSTSVEEAERREHVLAALGGLSDVQREAIELAYYEGLSHSEIAERLHQPLGTVKTRVRLAMQKLRNALLPYHKRPDD